MHHLSCLSRRKGDVTHRSGRCQDLVRFFALLRIKPHAPPLVRVPVNSFEFHSCERTPQVEYLLRLLRHRMSSDTRHLVFIVYGVDYQGYLILFAPHAFEPQRHYQSRQAAFATGVPPNIYAFHRYTRNSACLS